MKTMMEEELVHHDIINKLWQVYSKYACLGIGWLITGFSRFSEIAPCMSTSRGDHYPWHVCARKTQRRIGKGRCITPSRIGPSGQGNIVWLCLHVMC